MAHIADIATVFTPNPRSLETADSLFRSSESNYLDFGDAACRWGSNLDAACDSLNHGAIGAEAIFGNQSELLSSSGQVAEAVQSVHSPIYQIVALLLLTGYCVLLSRQTDDILWMFSTIYRTNRLSINQRNGVISKHILTFIASIGIIAAATFITNIAAKTGSLTTNLQTLSSTNTSTLLATTAALFGVAIYQRIILATTAYITINQQFILLLRELRERIYALLALWLIPPMILYIFAAQGQGEWLLYWGGIGGIIIGLLFFYHSILLFVNKKVSILNWFLYLCAVEIFPLTLLWGIVKQL